MGNITIRNIPDDIHDRLKQIAAQHNRSTEAEVRTILTAAVNQHGGVGLGAQMLNVWKETLGDDLQPERSIDSPREVSFE